MQVTAFARGYLSLVGALEQGAGIRQGADFLSPVVNVTDLLGLSFRKRVTSSTALASGSFLPLHVVPQGKIWRFRDCGVVLLSAVGETAGNVTIGYKTPEMADLTVPVALHSPVQLAANTTLPVFCQVPNDLYLPSGSIVGPWAISVVGNPSANVSLVVEELPA